MDSFQLKPCPACGASVKITGGDEWHNQHEFWICCENKECGCVRVGDTEREECIRRWNDLPRALNWTKEPPTKEGWYWFKDDMDYPYVVQVAEFAMEGNDLMVAFTETEEIYPLTKFSGAYWAGPITTPKENK